MKVPGCKINLHIQLKCLSVKTSNFQFTSLSGVLLWSSCNRADSSKKKKKEKKLKRKSETEAPVMRRSKYCFTSKYCTETEAVFCLCSIVYVNQYSLYYSLLFPSWVALPNITFCWVSAMLVLDIVPQIQDIQPQQSKSYTLCSYTIHLVAEP